MLPAVALDGVILRIVLVPVIPAPVTVIPGIRTPLNAVYPWVALLATDRVNVELTAVGVPDTVTALANWRVGQKAPPEWCWYGWTFQK
jgi:hypothetical protein